MLHVAWIETFFHSVNTFQQPKYIPAPRWAPIIRSLVKLPQTTSLSRISVFNVGGAYQDYQDHGWGLFSEVEEN